jgi:pimeloyl-ACP methyl ester carboxylesterase
MDRRDATVISRADVSSDGVRLAAWTRGTHGPPVVFVHGYPDTSAVWDPITERLSGTHRCLGYDVRGAGASDAPADRGGYRIERLVDDLVAVVDALSPDDPVHLVGHDWGSVVAWEAACRTRGDGRLSGRIASLTSISGPCLGHVGAFYRSARRADWRTADGRALKRQAIVQAARSWYVYGFQIPRVADTLVRRQTRRLVADPARGRHFGPTLPDDAVNGLNLYRANVGHYRPIPGGPRTDLPVLLIVPLRDRYVTPALTSAASAYVPNLARVEIDAGHWVVQSRPDDIAALVAGHVGRHAVPRPGAD